MKTLPQHASSGWKLIRMREYFERHPRKHAAVLLIAISGPLVGLALTGLPGFGAGAALSALGYFAGRDAVIKVRVLEDAESGQLEPEAIVISATIVGGSLETATPAEGKAAS